MFCADSLVTSNRLIWSVPGKIFEIVSGELLVSSRVLDARFAPTRSAIIEVFI